jgi:hypothetical protein
LCDCPRYHPDDDGDGFGAAGGSERVTCAPPQGWVLDDTDCFDGNSTANPAAIGTWPVDRGDGSFDYDCDGLETPYFDHLGRCDDHPWCEPGPIDGQGWAEEIPPCGVVAEFLGDCDWAGPRCARETGPLVQHCS